MTYSLLLHALDPKPTRQELEEISVKVPSVARTDCAFMVRDWFGIVTSGLSIADAQAFQAGLRGKGIATDIVPDADIPALHPDFRCQRIDLAGSAITLTTALNRRQLRDKGELVFLAAGKVIREKSSRKSFKEPRRNYNGHGDYEPPVVVTTTEYIPTEFFRKRRKRCLLDRPQAAADFSWRMAAILTGVRVAMVSGSVRPGRRVRSSRR